MRSRGHRRRMLAILACVLWLFGILIVALGLAVRALETREYVLEQ